MIDVNPKESRIDLNVDLSNFTVSERTSCAYMLQ